MIKTDDLIAKGVIPDALIRMGIRHRLAGDTEARTEIQKGLDMPNRETDDPETKARGRATLKGLRWQDSGLVSGLDVPSKVQY